MKKSTWITVKKKDHIQKTLDGQEVKQNIKKTGSNSYTIETFETSLTCNKIIFTGKNNFVVCNLPKKHNGECDPFISLSKSCNILGIKK